ncbi:hypothetical protein E5288_WYG018665 [Bos mutus]|uniref:Uncharacterized protein n=1 Tax=Bos mutus TaxID=72004 RepID=A0A6B0QZN3_9CETA|nr:hypothetical protein [Bos mutus]
MGLGRCLSLAGTLQKAERDAGTPGLGQAQPGALPRPATLPAPRRPCTADYISHNAHQGRAGPGPATGAGPPPREAGECCLPEPAIGKGRWEGVVACAVAMSASTGGRGPANLSHQSGPGRIPVPSRGSGRGQ